MREISSFEKGEIESALAGIARARVGLVGDMCLDAYWTADMKKSELSRETPHFPLPVVSERYSPGAGGNAAANIRALEPARLTVFSVLGDDWRGALLKRELAARGIRTDRVLVAPEIIQTRTSSLCAPAFRTSCTKIPGWTLSTRAPCPPRMRIG